MSKLSLKLLSKKNCRRNRNRLKFLSILLIPVSLIISLISLCSILLLVKNIHKPTIISPVISPFPNDSTNDDESIIELGKLLQEKKISYLTINKISNSLFIKLTNSSEVIISSQKELNQEITSLQYLLARLTMEGKDFSRLDLRFEKPVIVLK